ncbi:MAG: hypothetical protein ACKVZ0_06520 [Gemmatimonadales bacterium]
MRTPPRATLASFALAILGFSAAVTSLGNGYTQDDQPIIERNDRVHSLAEPGRFFAESYWPEPYDPALYRPLASIGYAIQWVAGGGAPLVFRLVSIALVVAAGIAVFRLGRRVLPEPVAWLMAAVFVVHPVHVEAVAAAVNQSELVVGLIAAVLVAGYLDQRHHSTAGRGFVIRLSLLFLTALLFKESAAVLVGIVLAAEIILVRDPAPLAARLARIRPTILGLLLGVVVFMAVRAAALGGNLLGTFVAEGLENLSLGQRAVLMLGVVPHWFRLLLWPAHLRADYSPREIEPTAIWGPAQSQGAVLLLITLALVWYCWRRAPVVAFGLVWAGIAIFPVSNVLVPTGVVLAERTLFFPSIGMMLAIGGGLAALWRHPATRPGLRLVVAGAALVVIGLGASRSASRFRVWRNNEIYWRQAVIDAPRSYRAGHAYAQLLFATGDRAGGEREFRRAVALYPKALTVYNANANRLRLAGMCADAVVFYDRTLIVEPQAVAARSGMIACLLYDGRYAEASAAAKDGGRIAPRPGLAKLFSRFQQVADSAGAVGAPAGTVRFSIRASDTLP